MTVLSRGWRVEANFHKKVSTAEVPRAWWNHHEQHGPADVEGGPGFDPVLHCSRCKLQARLLAAADRNAAKRRGLAAKLSQTEKLREIPWTPYDEQRKVLRSFYAEGTNEWALVAGRQVGKTDLAVALTIRVALSEPGSYSVLLAPTYPIARTGIDKMRQATQAIPGVQWKEQQKRMIFPNGSVWAVTSADKGADVGRGPTLTGLLWVDEAGLVKSDAWRSTLGSLVAVADPRKLLTTTPMGKNWVYDFWGGKGLADDEKGARGSFRFKSTNSPFANQREIERLRKLMGPEMAAQELDAEFVDSLILAFPDLSRLFVDEFPDRSKEGDLRNTLGVDFGKAQDWTVCTLVNKYGEVEVLDRFRTDYTACEDRVAMHVADHDVGVLVLDESGVGVAMADRFEKQLRKVEVMRFKTNIIGQKAKAVELARADVKNERIRVRRGPFTDQLIHELKRFQGTSYVLHGTKHVKYEGVQVRGEHDDCVISLVLANWGREHGWAKTVRKPVDLRSYVSANRSKQKAGGGTSYRFRLPGR